jgi:DNA repair protein RadA/Sms
MAKQQLSYSCTACGALSSKWSGCCSKCNAWNCIEEVKESVSNTWQGKHIAKNAHTIDLKPLSAVATRTVARIHSGIKEWDRVLGGGIVPGAFLVLTGDPGIGKSTLMLHIAYAIAHTHRVIYISSEESLEQLRLRAERLGCAHDAVQFADSANLDSIIQTAEQLKPDLLIIDSIQNCYSPGMQSAPGSIGYLKEAAFRLMRLAKDNTIAVLCSGHITKDGLMAGPKTLEHVVDAVFYLQAEDRLQTRLLRSVKNRFGTIDELGFFQMTQTGLVEVPNINEHLIAEATGEPGSILISSLEGSRPLLIELQALTIASKFTTPQRVVSGLDHAHVVLIASILEKHLRVKFSAHDIFFRVGGGFRIKSQASDLGIALALLSSYFQEPLPPRSLALGELSLTGQIKPVNYIDIQCSEALKFGLKKLIASQGQVIKHDIAAEKVRHVLDLPHLFSRKRNNPE